MRLPHRDPIRLGPTPYEVFQEREGIPFRQGIFYRRLDGRRGQAMGADGRLGFLSKPGEQQETDAYICEIPAGKQTDPQHHCSRRSFISTKGAARQRFGSKRMPNRLSNGAPGRSSQSRSMYPISISTSRMSRCVFLAAPTRPTSSICFTTMILSSAIPFNFATAFVLSGSSFNENKRLTVRSWESNLVPDINEFPLDDYPMKGKGGRSCASVLREQPMAATFKNFLPAAGARFTATGPARSFASRRARGSPWSGAKAKSGHVSRSNPGLFIRPVI